MGEKMEIRPLVSILMTAFNREKHIAVAIESVLASTYNHFELIIVDDGSTDQTVCICDRFADKDARIKVYRNDHNLGDYGNRNRAASYAKGVYLKYVDADDCIYPWGLACLVNMMEQFPEAGWGLCSLDQDNERPFPFLLSPREAYSYHYFGRGLFHKAPLSSIIKRETFEAVGGFRDIRMAGDFEMWHRLAKQFPVVLMPHGMVWYRRHEQQEIKSYLKYIKVYEKVRKEALTAIDCPLEPAKAALLLKRTKRKHLKNLFRSAINLNAAGIKESWLRITTQ